jgi:hypothetical protein
MLLFGMFITMIQLFLNLEKDEETVKHDNSDPYFLCYILQGTLSYYFMENNAIKVYCMSYVLYILKPVNVLEITFFNLSVFITESG